MSYDVNYCKEHMFSDIASFNGNNSYIKLSTKFTDAHKPLKIQLYFKTDRRSGILLAAFYGNSNSFKIIIRRGRLCFMFNEKKKCTELRYSDWNDGNWHKIALQFWPSGVSFYRAGSLNGILISPYVINGGLFLENNNIYVGGIPSSEQSLGLERPFEGCLKLLSIDRRPLNFKLYANQEDHDLLDMEAVLLGCPK